jgi:transcription initiation factor IIE alpha subunit
MPTTKPKTQSKADLVIALLSRGKGASIDEICNATKWQKHSTRAFLTGLRKKGLIIIREQRGNEGTVYRVAETPHEKTQQAAS